MTTNKRLVEGSQLTTSVATYYTAPAKTTTLIKKVTATNTSGGAVSLTLYLVPSAGSSGDASTITDAKAIGAGATYEAYEAENQVLMPGDSIQALADANTSVTLMVSGIEIV
jgi:hypothetical protein